MYNTVKSYAGLSERVRLQFVHIVLVTDVSIVSKIKSFVKTLSKLNSCFVTNRRVYFRHKLLSTYSQCVVCALHNVSMFSVCLFHRQLLGSGMLVRTIWGLGWTGSRGMLSRPAARYVPCLHTTHTHTQLGNHFP